MYTSLTSFNISIKEAFNSHLMFKPSQPMMARLRLTTKQVNGGYYKGNRTGSMGYFAKNGSYVIDWKKVRTYVVPESLDTFKVDL
jgi:large subunit ribosomal protein L41